jgi:hypothetical protein
MFLLSHKSIDADPMKISINVVLFNFEKALAIPFSVLGGQNVERVLTFSIHGFTQTKCITRCVKA